MDLARNIGCFFEICTRIDFRSFFFNSLAVKEESLSDIEKKNNENNGITIENSVPVQEKYKTKVPQKNINHLHQDKYLQKNDVNQNDSFSINKNKLQSSIPSDEPRWIIYQETSNDIPALVQTNEQSGITMSRCGTQKFKEVTTLHPIQLAELQNNKTLIRRPLYRTRFVAIRHKRINPTPKQQPCKRNEVCVTTLQQETKSCDSTATFPLQNVHRHDQKSNKKHYPSTQKMRRFPIPGDINDPSQIKINNDFQKPFVSPKLQKCTSVPSCFQQPLSTNFVRFNFIQNNKQRNFLNKNKKNEIPTKHLTLQNQDEYKLNQTNKEVTSSSLDNDFTCEPIKNTASYEKFGNFYGQREKQVRSGNSHHINLAATGSEDKIFSTKPIALENENNRQHCNKSVLSPAENRIDTLFYTQTAPFNQSESWSNALKMFSMKSNGSTEKRPNFNEETLVELMPAIASNKTPSPDFCLFRKNVQETDSTKIKKFTPQADASSNTKPSSLSVSFSNQNNNNFEVNKKKMELEALSKIENNKEFMIKNVFSAFSSNQNLTISKIPTKASMNFREREENKMQAGAYDERTRRLFLQTKLQPPQSIYKQKTTSAYDSNSTPSYTRYDVNSRNMMVYPQSLIQMEEDLLEKSPNLSFAETRSTTIVDDQVQHVPFSTVEKNSINTNHIPLSYDKPIQIKTIPLIPSQTSKSGRIILHPMSLTLNTKRPLLGSTDTYELEPSFFSLAEKAVNNYTKNTFHNKQHVHQKEQSLNGQPNISKRVIQEKNIRFFPSKFNKMYIPKETSVRLLTTPLTKEVLNRPINIADLPANLRFNNVNKLALNSQSFVNDPQTQRKAVPISSLNPKALNFFTDKNGSVPPNVQDSSLLNFSNKSDTLCCMQPNVNGIHVTLRHESFIKEQHIQKKQSPLSVIKPNQIFSNSDQSSDTSHSSQGKEPDRTSNSNRDLCYNQHNTNITDRVLHPDFFIHEHQNQENDLPHSSATPQQTVFFGTESINHTSSFQNEKCLNDLIRDTDRDSTLHYTNVTDSALSTSFFANKLEIQQQSYPVSSFSSSHECFTFSDKESNVLSPTEKKDTFRTTDKNTDIHFSQRNADKHEPTLYNQFLVTHQQVQDESLSLSGENVFGKTTCSENDNTINHPIKNGHSHYIQHNDQFINKTLCPQFFNHHEDIQNDIENFLNADLSGLSLFNDHHCQEHLSEQEEAIFNSPTNDSCSIHRQNNLKQRKPKLNSVFFSGEPKGQDKCELNGLCEEKTICLSNDNNNKAPQTTPMKHSLHSFTKINKSFSPEYQEKIKRATLFTELHQDNTKIPIDNKNVSPYSQNDISFPSHNSSKRKFSAQDKENFFHNCTEEASIFHLNQKKNVEEADISSVEEFNHVNSPDGLSFTKEIFYTFADEDIQQLPSTENVHSVKDAINDFVSPFKNEKENSCDMDVLSDTLSYRKRKEIFSEKVSTAQNEQSCLNFINKNEILLYIDNLRELALQFKLKNSSEPMSAVKRPRLKLHSTDSEENNPSHMPLNTIKEKKLDRMTYPSPIQHNNSIESFQQILTNASVSNSLNKKKTIKSLLNEIKTLREERDSLHQGYKSLRASMKEEFKDLIDLTDDIDSENDFSSPKDVNYLDLRKISNSEDKGLLLCLWEFLLKNEKERFENIPSTLLHFCSNLKHYNNKEDHLEKTKFSLENSSGNHYKEFSHNSSKPLSFPHSTSSSLQSDAEYCVSQSSSFYETSEQKSSTKFDCENRFKVSENSNSKIPIPPLKPVYYEIQGSLNTGRESSKLDEAQECQQTSRDQSDSLVLNSSFLVDLTNTSRTSSEEYNFSDSSSLCSQSPLIASRLPVKPPFVPKIKNISLLGVSSWNSGTSTAGEFIPEDLTNPEN